jgi:hypothetical protein
LKFVGDISSGSDKTDATALTKSKIMDMKCNETGEGAECKSLVVYEGDKDGIHYVYSLVKQNGQWLIESTQNDDAGQAVPTKKVELNEDEHAVAAPTAASPAAAAKKVVVAPVKPKK